jgi:cellulose synthase/poly-beta-1,6-N-acetylglucosamine synthase-like glycosyltransferase
MGKFAVMESNWVWIEKEYWYFPLWAWFILCGICFFWLVQLFYFIRYFAPLGKMKADERALKQPGVSVIVCARNEEDNLMINVPRLMEQDYPNFELIVVNDSSYDDTADILKALSINYPKMHVIHIDEDKQNMQGKKFALTLGIKAAKNDIVVLTDADCYPRSQDWLSSIVSKYKDGKQVVLGYSPFKKQMGWLNKLARFDNVWVGMQYLGMAKAGLPYMGVGRNLSYYTDLFFKVGGFRSHYSLTSGDDDLLINQIATKSNCVVAYDKDSQTISPAKRTMSDWKIQKRRHFTTSPMYRASDKRRLAFLPFSWFALHAFVLTWLILMPQFWYIAGVLLIRWALLVMVTYRFSKVSDQSKDVAWLAPLLEVQLNFLHVTLYMSNLIRKPQKWS